MTDMDTELDPGDFIAGFIEHALGRTPAEVAAYNREYYLRNRKLKGRAPGSAVVKAPVKAKQLYEDQVPANSRRGGKLVDFNNGVATYEDGDVLDANGWRKGGKRAVADARALNNANRAKNGLPSANVNARSADEPQNLRGAEARASASLNKWAAAADRYAKMPPGPAKVQAKKTLDLVGRKLEAEVDKYKSDNAARMKKTLQAQRKRLTR